MPPWEKYQRQQAGPWEKYQKASLQQVAVSGSADAISGPYVPFVDDTGMRAPKPRVSFAPGAGQVGTSPREAVQAASIGAFTPDEAPEYARSTGQAMKEATAALPLIPIGGKALEAPKLLGRMGRGAVAAGGSGYLYGVGTGEGDVDERLDRGLETGVMGAGIGVAAPPIIEGAAGLTRFAADKLGPAFNRLAGRANAAQGSYRDQAARKVAQTIQEQFPDMAPEDAIRNAQRIIQRYGPRAALMDAGELTRELAKATVRQGGTPGMQIERFVRQRQEGQLAPSAQVRGGQYERVAGMLEGASEGQQSGLAAQRSLKAQQGRASTPLYERTANDPANLVSGPKFEAAKADPYVAEQIAKVKGSKLHGMADLPDNSMPVIDATQKRMSDAAGKAYRQGKAHEGNLISEKRRALVEAADEAFPDYAKAREVWRDFKGVMDADDLGQKFMRGDVDVLQDAVSRMNDAEKAQFRAGVVKALRQIAGKAPDSGDMARKLLRTPELRERIRIAFDSPQAFRKFIKGLIGERELFKAYSEITRGSDTAKNFASMQRSNVAPDDMTGAALDAATGNKLGLLYRAGRALTPRGILGPPEPVRKEIAGLLTGQDIEPLLQAARRAGLSQAQIRALQQSLLIGQAQQGGRLP